MLKTLSILFVVLFLSIQIKYFSIDVFLRTIPKLLLILFYNNINILNTTITLQIINYLTFLAKLTNNIQ